VFVTAPPLPAEVKPGQSFTGDFRAEEAWNIGGTGGYREVRVVFFDQLGNEYVSDPTPVGEPTHSRNSWTVDPVVRPSFVARLKRRLRGLPGFKPPS
jgi:hypothetical protein